MVIIQRLDLAGLVLKIKDVFQAIVQKEAVNNVSQAFTGQGQAVVHVQRSQQDVQSAQTETLAQNAQAVG